MMMMVDVDFPPLLFWPPPATDLPIFPSPPPAAPPPSPRREKIEIGPRSRGLANWAVSKRPIARHYSLSVVSVVSFCVCVCVCITTIDIGERGSFLFFSTRVDFGVWGASRDGGSTVVAIDLKNTEYI